MDMGKFLVPGLILNGESNFQLRAAFRWNPNCQILQFEGGIGEGFSYGRSLEGCFRSMMCMEEGSGSMQERFFASGRRAEVELPRHRSMHETFLCTEFGSSRPYFAAMGGAPHPPTIA
ncbi:hypothetical protein HAX54_034919 [Datura stramonium]|uniref:Uncharacterized protein n=1 Tax=Datura stramonium TaxID=4076 RepID=A0ABS8SF04_DATST|nr:hypothetical protein [Datura stramonium]